MNKVFLSGNLTRDPELRYTQTGKAMTRMGIAVNRPYSKEKAVDFFTLIAWEKTAEFAARYLVKGSRVLLEGTMRNNSYENKEGVKVNTVEIWIDNIEFAGSRPQSDGEYGGQRDGYNKPAGNYNRRDENSYGSGNSAPPKKNDYDDFGGEQIDPDDTPF